jgi:hypothetical protein
VLRFVARDNSLSISSNLPPEVVLNKGVNLSVLYNHVLEHVAYVTCLSRVSILRYREGRGYKKGAIRYKLL